MIWCVEDDASIREIELYTLRSTGFEARGFEDGGAFLAALETERPELVILDVMLPGMDGVELLRRMKAAAHLANIPIIMATAKGAEYDKIQSLDLGGYKGRRKGKLNNHRAEDRIPSVQPQARGQIPLSKSTIQV